MDPVEGNTGLSTSGAAAAPPAIHYHTTIYNIGQADNVQIGDYGIINTTKRTEEDGVNAVDIPTQPLPPLEVSAVSSNSHPSPPPAPQTQPLDVGVTDTNPPEATPNIRPAEPQSSPRNCTSSTSTNNGSHSKPHVSPPKLDPSLRMGKISFSVRHKLTSKLSVKKPDGNDWRLLAEKLGYEPHYVALWDQRKENPAETLLQAWSVQSEATVGRLHALLVECDMADIAQLL